MEPFFLRDEKNCFPLLPGVVSSWLHTELKEDLSEKNKPSQVMTTHVIQEQTPPPRLRQHTSHGKNEWSTKLSISNAFVWRKFVTL